MAMAAAASRSCSNTGTIAFAAMPATTVNGVEIYNSAGTVRKAYGALTTPRTTAAGDTLSFAAGSVIATKVISEFVPLVVASLAGYVSRDLIVYALDDIIQGKSGMIRVCLWPAVVRVFD